MQQQAELIGLKAMASRAIRFQVQFVIFDFVFRLTTSAVEVLVEHLGAGLLHICHHKTGVDALLTDFYFDHHAACARPCLGLVARRVKAGYLPSAGGISPLGLLDHLTRQCLQDGITRQASHLMECGLRVDPLPHLGIGEVAITAKDHQGVRPGVPQVGNQPLQHCEPLRTREAFRLENGRDEAP